MGATGKTTSITIRSLQFKVMNFLWRQVVAVCLLFTSPLTAMLHADEISTGNPTQQENLWSGTVDWKLIKPALHREIEGYASSTSVNRGQQITFYVHTQDPSYDCHLSDGSLNSDLRLSV